MDSDGHLVSTASGLRARRLICCASHHAGQMCTAGSRIFVQEGIYDEFIKYLSQAAQAAQPGNGFDTDHKVDPVVSKTQFDVRGAAYSIQKYLS